MCTQCLIINYFKLSAMINVNLIFFLSFLIIHFSSPYFSYFPFPLFFSSYFLLLLSRSPLFSPVLFLNHLLFLHSRVAERLHAQEMNGGQRRSSGHGWRTVGNGAAPGTGDERRAAAVAR
jgi:hypothetical protein